MNQYQYHMSCLSLNSNQSLDEYLCMVHCKNDQQMHLLQIEKNIVAYLKSLGIEMKTDPGDKFKRKARSSSIKLQVSLKTESDIDQQTSMTKEESLQNISQHPSFTSKQDLDP